ncbi:hypothetical protein M9458_035390, partial [Cirrhinus mrigala]
GYAGIVHGYRFRSLGNEGHSTALDQVISTMVVQERHLWLDLAQMSDADKVCFLDAPISQASLFGDT